MDLVDFLRARLDEDERWALGAKSSTRCLDNSDGYTEWSADEDGGEGVRAGHIVVAVDPNGFMHGDCAGHIARHDPARVLAEVDTKRRIIAECGHMIRRDEPERSRAEWILRVLALPFHGHSQYRPEWAPDA
jgi:hypothetical protein